MGQAIVSSNIWDSNRNKIYPTFCGLYVGELEQNMLDAWSDLDPESLPNDWWRFIDDCLFWWSGRPGDLLIFFDFVNKFNPYIKFTIDYNFTTRCVEFLDLRIWVDDCQLLPELGLETLL